MHGLGLFYQCFMAVRGQKSHTGVRRWENRGTASLQSRSGANAPRCRRSQGRRRLRVVPGGAALPRTALGTAACVKQQPISARAWDVPSLRAGHMERCGKLELKVVLKISAILSETTFFFPLAISVEPCPTNNVVCGQK